MESCESCGLPSWAVSSPGQNLCLATKATKFKRASKKTVWVCSPNCALCARAVAEMGLSSHSWPITLAQFALLPSDTGLFKPHGGLTVKSTSDNSQCLQGSQDGKNEEMTLPHQEAVKVPTAVKSGPRKGGRPKVKDRKSPAEYQRAYRERQRVSDTPMQAAAG